MNPLDMLFGQIARRIQNHASPNTPGPSYDSNGILDELGNLFNRHAQQSGSDFQGYNRDYDYTSDDNYRDDDFDNIASSNQDPFGDPGRSSQRGDDNAFGNVRSSNEDPFGDPGLQR